MENMLVVTVAEPSLAYEVLRELRRLSDDGDLTLRGAAIVERHLDGRWHFPEETEEMSYSGAMTGGALGALIGLLAGPAGLLVGAGAGFLIGSAAEVNDVENVETTLHALPRRIPPGATGLVADVYETSPFVADGVLGALGASVERMSRREVEADIAALEAQPDEQAETRPGRG